MRVSFSTVSEKKSIDKVMIGYLHDELLRRARELFNPSKWLTISSWARHEKIDRRLLTSWLKACDLDIGKVRIHCYCDSMSKNCTTPQ